MSNRQKLHALIKELELTRKDAACVLGISVHTLNNWLTPETSKCSRPCPQWPIHSMKMLHMLNNIGYKAKWVVDILKINAPD